jgi:hypothetical protein
MVDKKIIVVAQGNLGGKNIINQTIEVRAIVRCRNG